MLTSAKRAETSAQPLINPQTLAAGSRPSELRGMAMVLVSTIAWSFAGLFTRALTIDVYTAVSLRSLAGGLLLLAIALVRRRRGEPRFGALRWPEWISVAVNVLAQASFTACLYLTSVAHVAVIYAFTPFIAALIAWRCLGERITVTTLAAIVVSGAGVATVVAGSWGTGGALGDALALVMTTSFAILIVLPKAYPDLRLTEPTLISAFIVFALFLPLSHVGSVDLRNAALIVAYGSINLVLAYFLFLHGARFIPAATAGLIATLEIVLSPLWVWLFLGESVDGPTLIGGAVVFSAVIGHIVSTIGMRPDGHDPDGTLTLGMTRNG